jgi:hypothetical protein
VLSKKNKKSVELFFNKFFDWDFVEEFPILAMSGFGKKPYLTFKILFDTLNLRPPELEFLIRELG